MGRLIYVDNQLSIEKILEIFKLSDAYLSNNQELRGQTSRHWKEMNAEKSITRDELVNFRKLGGLSLGLDDHRNSFGKTLDYWHNLLPRDLLLEGLPIIDVGNAGLSKLGPKYLDLNRIHHIYWLYLTESLIDIEDSPESIVCEIGGGFGSFTELIMKRSRKAVLIDLPLSNTLATYYISRMRPTKKLFLFDDYQRNGEINIKDFETHDIFILPPGCKFSQQVHFSLIVNSRSFMEMSRNAITSHFQFIVRHLREGGYFLNINRYQKITSGQVINFHEYPYDPHWQVVKSTQLESQPHIHLLLTKRLSKSVIGNVMQELRSIKMIGSGFRLGPFELLLQLLKNKLYDIKRILLGT